MWNVQLLTGASWCNMVFFCKFIYIISIFSIISIFLMQWKHYCWDWFTRSSTICIWWQRIQGCVFVRSVIRSNLTISNISRVHHQLLTHNVVTENHQNNTLYILMNWRPKNKRENNCHKFLILPHNHLGIWTMRRVDQAVMRIIHVHNSFTSMQYRRSWVEYVH